MRKALSYYANPNNYIDGVALGLDEDGHMVVEDNGDVARRALRMDDLEEVIRG
jgi:hypothetical protein